MLTHSLQPVLASASRLHLLRALAVIAATLGGCAPVAAPTFVW